MISNRLFLVQLPAAARVATLAALRENMPDAETLEVSSVDEASHKPKAHYPELLVLGDSASTEAVQAAQTMNGNGFPRWAVIILGESTNDFAENIPAAQWSPPLLARVFRNSLLQHGLMCENLRLRGDLKTVARRFSHDLYTPVGCIHTSASVLKSLPPGDEQSMAVIIQNIEDSSTEIAQLMERVSFVLRASADPCALSEVKMGDVVDAVLSQLSASIRKAGATVTAPPQWPGVSGVPNWLKVIWWNFLNNALKHGGPNVRIRIGWNPGPNGNRFWVSDNGPGVKPEIQTGFFQPFDQLHTKRATGLGLSFVQRLISLQGGTCGYEPVPEGGACFYFVLPGETS